MNGSIWLKYKWRKPLKRVGKTGAKPLEKSYRKQPPNSQFIEIEKLAVGSQIGLSVDRPVDRPTVRFLTVVPAVYRPVDRSLDTESRLSVRSTGPVDWGFPESRALWRSTDPVDRPSSQAGVHVLCTSVDRLGRPTEARSGQIRDLKGCLFG